MKKVNGRMPFPKPDETCNII